MKKLTVLTVGAALLAVALLAFQCKTEPTPGEDHATVSEESPSKMLKISSPNHPNLEIEPSLRFPDFRFLASPGDYDGRVFLLSQDFPKEMPEKDAGVKKILAMDYKADWKAYALAVRDYVLEGNGNPDDIENSFYLEDNKVRSWYHVPWQHWGSTGREGIHGLTQEGPINAKMLAQEQESKSHAYAVGFYNDLGGYTIGQVWPEIGPPSFDYLLEGKGFPEGTIVGKVLYTTLTDNEVPYLVNPVSWQASVYAYDVPGSGITDNKDQTRIIAPVQLIQMDIMVRDEKAIETGGWVFGTFVYNGTLGNEDPWKNLQPVGVMWGNDPTVKISLNNEAPIKTITNPDLQETVINDDASMPAMHLGWGFRLNGPVDNANSSCMSCHSTAQYPGVSSILPMFNKPAYPVPPVNSLASEGWMRWFRNVPCGTPFDAGKAISFDYSLQLQKSVENYVEYLNETQQGKYYLQYWDSPHKASRNIVD